MARINTNVPSLLAQSRLGRTNRELNLRLERLSTGLRINRGRDDPAGMIISERIRSDIAGIDQAINNADRASSVTATTEASLAEVGELLNTIRSLVVEAANTGANSQEEREANQLQIDSAIDSITRISNTASFGGLRLLDGSRGFTTSSVVASAISMAQVKNALFPPNAGAVNVDVDVLASAQRGALFFDANSQAVPGQLASSMTLEIAGEVGVTTLQFTSGQQLADVAAAVNSLTEVTGVVASGVNGSFANGIAFYSNEYGTDSFVSVERTDRPQDSDLDGFQLLRLDDGTQFDPNNVSFTDPNLQPATRDTGQDVTALVNGILANGDGLEVSVNSSNLSVDLLLNEGFAIRPAAGATSFDITGGGALFQLGPDVEQLQQVSIGIQSVSASNLGGTVINGQLQFLNSLKDGNANSIESSVQRNSFKAAQEILDKAIDDVAILRGRLGAFERNVVDTSRRSLESQFENLSASVSQIRDADFAFETSRLTRAQILSQSGTQVLQLANQQSQQVLQLLG